MMQKSLVYHLVNYRLDSNVSKIPTDENGVAYYKEVYTTSHKMVRIYKV